MAGRGAPGTTVISIGKYLYGQFGAQPDRPHAGRDAAAWCLLVELLEGIEKVLDAVLAEGDFVAAIHNGVLGSRAEGAYPGRTGKDTVTTIKK
jgi:hypothetical protein